MLFHEVCREAGIWDGDWKRMGGSEWIIGAKRQIIALGYTEIPCDRCNASGLSIDTYGAGVMVCNGCMGVGAVWITQS